MDQREVESIEAGDPLVRDAGAQADADESASSWKDVLIREVRSHPFGYGVMGVGLVTGPFLIMMIFPQVTPLQAIVGGLAFGVYAALCAVPQKFM
jgi:hypothetical protein